MQPEPLHVRIMDALVERLSTIQEGTVVYPDADGVAVEYWTTPKSIRRAILEIDQYKDTDLPLIGVARSSGTRIRRANRDTGAWEHEFVVMLVGYVLGDHESDTDAIVSTTRIERLIDDVRNCMDVDRTFGGLAYDSLPHPDGSLDTDDGAFEPRAAFEQPWLIKAHERL